MVIKIFNTTREKLMTTNIHRPGQFRIFAALGMAGSDSDHAGGHRDIPEYGAEYAQFVAEELGAQKPGEIIKGRCQQSGCHKAEEHGIDMHGSYTAEMDIFDIGQKVRRNQVTGADHAKRSCGGKPQCGCQRKRFGSRVARWHIFGDVSRQFFFSRARRRAVISYWLTDFGLFF
jgi:hypothetical protein